MSQNLFKAEVLPLREKLLNHAQKYMKDEQDAEDAVQEVLLKLWYIRDTLDGYDNLAAFATTVTKNHCLDRLKLKSRTEPLNENEYIRAGTDNPHLELEQKSASELIQPIIKTLPELQQAIIRMKDMEEYEIDEIAEITGTKAEAVRVNLSRARKKVRDEYIKWTTV